MHDINYRHADRHPLLFQQLSLNFKEPLDVITIMILMDVFGRKQTEARVNLRVRTTFVVGEVYCSS
jgi:hypothetical protein